MSVKNFVCLLFFLMGLSGCNDSKEVFKYNFKKAAQLYMNANSPLCYIIANFPLAISSDTRRDNMLEVLSFMAEKGLLTKRVLPQSGSNEFSADGPDNTIDFEYDLTDEGKKYYVKDITSDVYNNWELSGAFCFGEPVVTEITNYVEPADHPLGMMTTRVEFTYKVTNIPDWAKSPEISPLIYGLKEIEGQDEILQKSTVKLYLTNKGWMPGVFIRNQIP